MFLHRKKTLTAIATLILTNTFSVTQAKSINSWNGFSVSAVGGTNTTRTAINTNTNSTYEAYTGGESADEALTATTQIAQTEYNTSGAGEFSLLYRHEVKNSCFYLGLDTFLNLAGRQTSAQNSNSILSPENASILSTTAETKLNSVSYGFDALPGFEVTTKTLLYGRIGIAFDTATLTSNNNFNYSDTDGTQNSSTLNTSYKETLIGVRFGLGILQTVYKNLGITLDYIYTRYQNMPGLSNTTTQSAGTTPTPNGFTTTGSLQLSSQTALIGLQYRFSG